jgi:hypothetical protein
MSNRYRVLWVRYQNHVCDLSAWVSPSSLMALFAGLCLSFAFRLATFASWFFLFPLGIWALLTVGLLPLLTDPIGVTASRICEMRAGWVPFLLRGGLVPSHTEESPVCLAEEARGSFFSPNIIVFVSHIPMTFSYAASTRIHSRSPVRSSPSPVPFCG